VAKVHELLDRTRITSDGNVAFIRSGGAATSVAAEVSDSFQGPFTQNNAAFSLTNLGAGPTDNGGGFFVDLTDYAQIRFAVLRTTTGNTGVVRLIYSFDNVTFATLTTATLSLGGTGVVESDWEDIPAAARTLVFVDLRFTGGDGSEDPAGWYVAHFRR
jgi:hypothetical protein